MVSAKQTRPQFSQLQIVFFPASPSQHDVGKLWTSLTSEAPQAIQQVPAEGNAIAHGVVAGLQLGVHANPMRVEVRVSPGPNFEAGNPFEGAPDLQSLLAPATPWWRALLSQLGPILRVGVVGNRELHFPTVAEANREIASYLPFGVEPDSLVPFSDLAFQFNERQSATAASAGAITNVVTRHGVQLLQTGFFNAANPELGMQMHVVHSIGTQVDVNNVPLSEGVQGERAVALVDSHLSHLIARLGEL